MNLFLYWRQVSISPTFYVQNFWQSLNVTRKTTFVRKICVFNVDEIDSRSLEERQQKDNQARITDIAKLEGKLDTENAARKEEIAALDRWAKSENDSRKTEIANLDNFAKSENSARKDEIANLVGKITKYK